MDQVQKQRLDPRTLAPMRRQSEADEIAAVVGFLLRRERMPRP